MVPDVDGRGGNLALGAVAGELRPPNEIFLPWAALLAGRGDEWELRGDGERMAAAGLRVEDAERGSGGRP